MRRLLFFVSMAVCGAVLADGDEGLVEQKSGKGWHLRIGPVLAPRVRVKISAPSYVPRQASASAFSSSTAAGRAPADPSEGYVERQYADGYVKPDEGTEDPDSMISGLTWD